MRPHQGQTVYKLIHSQQMVQYMWRYTLHSQATQIPVSIAFDEQLDFDVLARAVNVEIARNDCLRLRIFRSGLSVREFFLPFFRVNDIPVKEFKTLKEQEKFFDSDASTKLDVFGGETFRIYFYRAYNGRSGIYLNVSHMVMDFVATFIFFRDLLAVYDALKNDAPLPKPLAKYEDIIKKEQDNEALEARLEKEAAILKHWVGRDPNPKFCFMNGQGFIDRQRRLLHDKNLNLPHAYMPLSDSTHLLKLRMTPEDSKVVSDFIEKYELSAEWVLQLGIRTYLSNINRRPNDCMLWVLCPRRKTVKEKRCGGTLASPMPWREIMPENLTFIEAARQLGRTQAFLFRHSDVPFTSVRKIEQELFDLSPMQSCNSMMFSYLPLEKNTFGGRVYEFTGYNFGHYVMPSYTLTTRDPWTGCFSFSYIHRLWLTNDDEVRMFHEGVVRTLLAGARNPEKTLGQIMEETQYA